MRPADKPYLSVRKMLRQIKKQGSEFTIFGGEPLLTPIKTLGLLFAYGFKHYKKNGIQTNGTLITERHIEMFRKYNVHVGISCDGPGELSDVRENRASPTATRTSTDITVRMLEILLKRKIGTSLIVTLHKNNAVGPNLEILVEWLTDLQSKGLRSARVHLMELDNPTKTRKLVLTAEEGANAVLRLSSIRGLDVDLLNEMRRNLLNDFSSSSCIWHGCDPYTTPAVVGIDADGTLSNCGRVNKNGVNYRKADTPGNERVLGLYRTPYNQGGCKGCRFFLACKGQCPGTGLKGDWRNRTEHCETLLILFQALETELVTAGKEPISLRTDRKVLEEQYLQAGVGTHADWHEDWHADVPHGDTWLVPVGRPE
jgi:uncharacterized protein